MHDYPEDGAYRGHVTLYQENIIVALMVPDRVTGRRVNSETLVSVLVASGLFTEAEARAGIEAEIVREAKWIEEIDRDTAIDETKR
ncbi:hypothetical protein ADL19_05540 [Streptomyces purpurogeneiscleroticus]|nr:hypothetical protein ADL19_05540 [Streptomyces purpurogeneiscleroticus]